MWNKNHRHVAHVKQFLYLDIVEKHIFKKNIAKYLENMAQITIKKWSHTIGMLLFVE